jgi:hypothetical protein
LPCWRAASSVAAMLAIHESSSVPMFSTTATPGPSSPRLSDRVRHQGRGPLRLQRLAVSPSPPSCHVVHQRRAGPNRAGLVRHTRPASIMSAFSACYILSPAQAGTPSTYVSFIEDSAICHLYETGETRGGSGKERISRVRRELQDTAPIHFFAFDALPSSRHTP